MHIFAWVFFQTLKVDVFRLLPSCMFPSCLPEHLIHEDLFFRAKANVSQQTQKTQALRSQDQIVRKKYETNTIHLSVFKFNET